MRKLIDMFEETTTDLETDGTALMPEARRSIAPAPAIQAPPASGQLLPLAPTMGDATTQLTLTGTPFNDTIDGSSGDDIILGLGGDDTLSGLGGVDRLEGRDGNDTLIGGLGFDVLNGGAGADHLWGSGNDTAMYGDAPASVSIDLTKASSTWTGDAQGDVLTGILEFHLSNFADTFRGDANRNEVYGEFGNDVIYGLGGDDVLIGGDGNDSLYGGESHDVVLGGLGDDYLQGNAADDAMEGGPGNDRMVGGTGNDFISGNSGGDYLVGEVGADIFRYFNIEESQNILIDGVKQLDQIVDFTQGEDKIDLSAIDANSGFAGDQAFIFLEDPTQPIGDWTGLVWQTTAANGIATINVSVDADADAEMQIYMSHAYQFTANDFIL